mmetsp:Transcript_27003/g.25862  ORF Transcript_27003/g.25862 Transcript_27003/m.25862 type:complete len:135 (-) Transcript_27003:24-428(-)
MNTVLIIRDKKDIALNINTYMYESSTSSIDETMDKVRGIFQYIKDIHNANAAASNDDNDDNVKPDTAAYTILLSAYANIVYSIYNKDIPYQCEQIFYEMKEHHNSIIPDERTYYYIIQTMVVASIIHSHNHNNS